MRALTVVLVLLLSAALTKGADEEVVGVLSYIGSTLEVDTSNPARSLPHVEVIDLSQFEACEDKASPDCRYEYPIPYVLEDEAKALERDLSKAWARFDARTAWRVNAAIFGKELGCSDKEDAYLGAWEGEPQTLKESEFCDGNLPDLPVTWFPLVCPNFYLDWQELAKRYGEAIAHAYTTYYPDYLVAANEAVLRHAPLALYWQGHQVPGQGATIFPVAGTAPSERWADLIQKAQDADPRGSAYMTQALPGMEKVRELLRNRPGEERSLRKPGIPALEAIKKELMNRGDIFAKPQFWAGQNGGPKPEGKLVAALPEEYQVYGVVPFMRTYAQFDVEVSPHLPIYWVGCINITTVPPLFVPIPIPLPIVHAASRVHTGWEVVPEGHPIRKGIKGDPVLR